METLLERAPGPAWEAIDGRMSVVSLSPGLRLFVPALALLSLSKGTRGMTLASGKAGGAVGAVLAVGGALLGALLLGPLGPVAAALSFWLIGTAGLATLWSSIRPTAFVKPICTGCRLLPVIREHEAIHLSGVASEKAVWDSMKTRHSVRSLSLDGDPSICSFCPIPKRLSGQ